MTSINLIDPALLHRQHLKGEYKEITRVFGLARKAQFDILKGKRKLPTEYTMGIGHVLYFYDKLKFVADRYELLYAEMHKRGYKPNIITRSELLAGIDSRLHQDYDPTPEAVQINLQRINERLATMNKGE